MALPKFLQSCLWSYSLSQMDPKEDKITIITQILNFGDKKANKWLFKTYSANEIKEVLRKPQRGMWLKSKLDYWLKHFDVKAGKFTYELALLSLKPRPKLVERFFREEERKNKKYHQRLKTLGLNSF